MMLEQSFPKLSLPSGVTISLIPSNRADARMILEGHGISVSVYLDMYEKLGANREYYELYDGNECVRFSIDDELGMQEYINELFIFQR